MGTSGALDGRGRVLRASVVVCTHNPRPELLARTLAAIAPQVGAAVQVELLIIDNASPLPVATLTCVAETGARVVVEPQLGLTSARACAARNARGDLIVFVDDDNILAEDYVERAIALFADPRVGVLSGRVEPEYVSRPPRWLRRHESALAIRRPRGDQLRLVDGFKYCADFPIGAGMVVRTELVRRYFIAAGTSARIEGRRGGELLAGEDTDLALFALSEGWRVGCTGILRLTHVIPAGRMSPDYIIRLNRGALLSARAVNEKWRARFGGDVFDFMVGPRWRVALKAAAFGALAFLPSFRVRAAAQRDLLGLGSRD